MMRSYLVFIFITLFFELSAQVYFKSDNKIKLTINDEYLKDDKNGLNIFRTLSIENNKGLGSIYLDIDLELKIKAFKNTSNNLQLSIIPDYSNVKGNINLRQFNIDSLLYPSSIDVVLIVFNGRHKVDERILDDLPPGKETIIDLSDFNNNIGELKLEVKSAHLFYNNDDQIKFDNMVELIKQYYSYCSLLDFYNNKYEKFSLLSNEGNEDICLHRIEVEIIKHNLDKLNNFQKLGLNYRDPKRV